MTIDLDITTPRMAFYHLRNAVMDHHGSTNPSNPETHENFWAYIDTKALGVLATLCSFDINDLFDEVATVYLCALYSLIHDSEDGSVIFPTDRNQYPDNYRLLEACRSFLPAFTDQ